MGSTQTKHRLVFIFLFLEGALIAAGMKYVAPILILVVGLFYLVSWYYLRTSRQMRFLDLEAKSPLFTLFTETATGLETIRALGAQEQFINDAYRALDHSQKPFYYMFAIQRWLLLSLELLALIVSVSLVALAVYSSKATSPEAFGLGLLRALQMNTLLTGLVEHWTNLETALGAVSRLRSAINGTPAEKTDTNDEILQLPNKWPQRGEIALDNVTARYGPESDDCRPVLCNVSITISPGQKVMVIGRTGSGKSSFLLSLLRLLEYNGSIIIDGIDISRVAHDKLRNRITTITQDPLQLDGTIRNNLIPYNGQQDDSSMTDELIATTLRRVGLMDHIQAIGGLDVSFVSVGFSHGQLQLLAFARAILHHAYTKSGLILMDEATSSVDLESDAIIQGLIREVFADCTVLMISHRTNCREDVDLVLEMDNGRLSVIDTEDESTEQ
jgi:ABC-type multidrug transport system fused ATPase/permease subunit